jgi:hypothetical protein
MSEYACPNGHPVALVEMLPCNAEGCMALVAYEPTAHGMALARQLQGAVEELQRIRDKVANASGIHWRVQRSLLTDLDALLATLGGQ